MPKDDKRKKLTQEEIDAQNEKFRTFFSTSVAQVPEEMKRRDEEKENTGSLLGKLFHREKDKEEPAAAPAVQNELPPTGEIDKRTWKDLALYYALAADQLENQGDL